ncbi:MAG: FtsW/RodA/SpoVE family cell cycle protein, partial [Bacilli bacterium]|nr:FtsW/RodA/SpoVE family cell cycle protein [Bacilli bacterium]
MNKVYRKNIFLLYIPLIILMIISLLNMKNIVLLDSTLTKNFSKQIIWYVSGILLLLIIQKTNSKKILKYSFWYYLISLFLLGLVLIIGKEINGAKAWFKIGNFSFQPSELTKFTLTLYLADVIQKANINGFKSELRLILKVLIITLLPSILVFIEPDTGAIIFYLLIAASMLFISGIKKWWFILLFLLLGSILFTFIILYIYNRDFLIDLIGTSFFYRVERLITFHTESSYQLENALTVIGSASLWGTGLGKVSLYIPEAATDFIFAFTIGNFGIVTGFTVLLCYFLIDLYLILAYFQTTNKKIKLFLISFISIFFFQQIINIGMNLG